MEWTKISTTLISKRFSDYELVSILKFQLLWAELEEQPDKKTALRYMTARQYDTAMTYLDSISSRVNDDVSSTIKKRKTEKIRYSKNKDLQKILPAECQQNVSSLPEQIREDKIREYNRGNNNTSVISEYEKKKELADKIGELIKKIPKSPLDFA